MRRARCDVNIRTNAVTNDSQRSVLESRRHEDWHSQTQTRWDGGYPALRPPYPPLVTEALRFQYSHLLRKADLDFDVKTPNFKCSQLSQLLETLHICEI